MQMLAALDDELVVFVTKPNGKERVMNSMVHFTLASSPVNKRLEFKSLGWLFELLSVKSATCILCLTSSVAMFCSSHLEKTKY